MIEDLVPLDMLMGRKRKTMRNRRRVMRHKRGISPEVKAFLSVLAVVGLAALLFVAFVLGKWQ